MNTGILAIDEFSSRAGPEGQAEQGFAPTMRTRLVVRAFDIVLSLMALVFFAPLMVTIAISIYISDPGPIIFAHKRIGLNEKTFRCLKFRSMAVDATERLQELLYRDAAAREEWARDHKLRNDPRIVGIGRLLRKLSLDELPQFFNVLMGEMSLVGPRPIVDAEVERYGRYFGYYCSVKPGISGLWQVSGRNNISYRRRVAMDVKFSKSQSISLYLKILFMTVPSVVFSRGSY
jgi:lipopolysaccharide/colanic/teichoic acid biosynthesis glycosyltransferase